MDPRRMELNRRHSREMGELYSRFLETHPDLRFGEIPMTDAEDAAWGAYSAGLLGRQQAERAALAAQLEDERRPRTGGAGRPVEESWSSVPPAVAYDDFAQRELSLRDES